MEPLFWLHVASGACVDTSLSVACGMMLAQAWLQDAGPVRGARAGQRALILAAATLFLASASQLLILSATFTGQRSFRAILSALPDVASTTAGKNIDWSSAAALLFLALVVVQTLVRLREAWRVAAFLLYLAVHSANGHAGVDGAFSLTEALQAVHLTAMALWSGGVIVSGLLVIGRNQLAQGTAARAYMTRLSTVSTVSVPVVALSGLCKAYRQIDGHPSLLRGSPWAYVLGAKTVVVTLALALGALNRWWLWKEKHWQASTQARSARALQLEAWIMIGVLVLSSVLGSTLPPGQ